MTASTPTPPDRSPFVTEHQKPNGGFRFLSDWWLDAEPFRSLSVERRWILLTLFRQLARTDGYRVERFGKTIGCGQWAGTMGELAKAANLQKKTETAAYQAAEKAVKQAEALGILSRKRDNTQDNGSNKQFTLVTCHEIDAYDYPSYDRDNGLDNGLDKTKDNAYRGEGSRGEGKDEKNSSRVGGGGDSPAAGKAEPSVTVSSPALPPHTPPASSDSAGASTVDDSVAPASKPDITDAEIIAGGAATVIAWILKGKPGAAAWAAGDTGAWHALPWSRDAWCKVSGTPSVMDRELTIAQCAHYIAARAVQLREAQGLPQTMPALSRVAGAVKDASRRRGSPYAVAQLMDNIMANWPAITGAMSPSFAAGLPIDGTLIQQPQVLAILDRLAAGQPVAIRQNPQPHTQEVQHANDDRREWSWS